MRHSKRKSKSVNCSVVRISPPPVSGRPVPLGFFRQPSTTTQCLPDFDGRYSRHPLSVLPSKSSFHPCCFSAAERVLSGGSSANRGTTSVQRSEEHTSEL